MLAALILMLMVAAAGAMVYNYVMHEGVILNGGAGVSLSSAQITSEPGGKGYFTLTVINSGGVPLSSITVSVYRDGGMIYTQTHSGLVTPGGSYTFTGTIQAGISDGSTYIITVTASSNQGTAAASQEVVAV